MVDEVEELEKIVEFSMEIGTVVGVSTEIFGVVDTKTVGAAEVERFTTAEAGYLVAQWYVPFFKVKELLSLPRSRGFESW